jgi:aminopeptidase YwaD
MQISESNLMKHLQFLCSRAGSRPIGTEGNEMAASYIEQVFHSAGLEVESQIFECPRWQIDEVFVEINNQRISGIRANTSSMSCDVVTFVSPLSTIGELEEADLTGKIALLYGGLTKEPLTAKGFKIYNPDRDQHIIRLLEEKQPAAILLVYSKLSTLQPLIADWDFHIPSATVSPILGRALLSNIENEVRVRINSTKQIGSTRNIIARKRGTRTTDRIILCAHYDTAFGTPGAFDNASGVAVLLSLAEEFGRRQLEVGLEFVAFSSEEYIGYGDQIFIAHNKLTEDQTIAALNIDGVGQLLGNNTVTVMGGSESLREAVAELADDYRSTIWTNPWYESNHYTFFSHGVPSIPFSCNGITDLIHTEEDTIGWISPERMNDALSLVVRLLIYFNINLHNGAESSTSENRISPYRHG